MTPRRRVRQRRGQGLEGRGGNNDDDNNADLTLATIPEEETTLLPAALEDVGKEEGEGWTRRDSCWKGHDKSSVVMNNKSSNSSYKTTGEEEEEEEQSVDGVVGGEDNDVDDDYEKEEEKEEAYYQEEMKFATAVQEAVMAEEDSLLTRTIGTSPPAARKGRVNNENEKSDNNVDDHDRTTRSTGSGEGGGSTGAKEARTKQQQKPPPPQQQQQPIWVSTGKETEGSLWELTWPIWHMLPRQERKSIASKYGFHTIGDFEENMTLRTAVDVSGGGGGGENVATDAGQRPYDNSLLHELESNPRNYGREHQTLSVLATASKQSSQHLDTDMSKRLRKSKDEFDNDDEESVASSSSSSSSEKLDITNDKKAEEKDDDNDPPDTFVSESIPTSLSSSSPLNADPAATKFHHHQQYEKDNHEHDNHLLRHLIQQGGLPLLLPDDLLHRTFSYLDVDMYGILALVSTTWQSFTRTERVYKLLCERCYLRQSRRKTLQVSKFGNSYRRMLEMRPRVRTGGGLYVLKYRQVKKIQRDMWTEIPLGAILESIYYRYLYFQENGTVLYALTSSPPHEMIVRFTKMKSKTAENNQHHQYDDKAAIWGKYEIQRRNVTVWATHPWHHVLMEFQLLPDGAPGSRGKFCAMSFERHVSSVSGNFDEYMSPDLVEYKVPNEPFLFLRDWRL